MVRRRRARERRIPPLLLHPRAFRALPHHGHDRPGPWYYFVPWFAVGILPWLTVLGVRRVAARGATARPMRSASRGSASRSSGRRSCSCSSARRDRSCRRTSCRCSRRWRSSSAGCSCASTTRTLIRLLLPLVVVGTALALALVFAYDRYRAATSRPTRHAGRRSCSPSARGSRRRRASPRRRHRRARRRSGAPRASRRSRLRRASRCVAFDSLAGLQLARRRLRRVQPDALDLGYPAGCAAGGALRRRTRPSTRSKCTIRPSRSTSAARRAASPSATSSRSASTPSRRSRCPTAAAWIAEWRGAARRATRSSEPELHARLAAEGVPMRELARDPRRVVVSRQ